MRIITRNIYPPIPERGFDWCAYHEGDEERGYRYGWGATESEALDDLKRLDQEEAEANEETEFRRLHRKPSGESGPVASPPCATHRPATLSDDWLDHAIAAGNWRDHWRRVVRAESGDDYENSVNVYGD